MSEDKKVVKLTKVVVEVDTAKTYLELLNEHIERLNDSRKDAKPIALVITALTEDGSMQEILIGDCVAQIVGLLEITKQNVYLDAMGIME